MDFQKFADSARKIKVRLTALANMFLAIQITAHILQVYYLRKDGEGIVNTLLLAFPTIVTTFFFYYIIKTSKKRFLVIDFIRIFAVIFALVIMFSFTLGIISGKYHFGENKFKAELAYQIAYIAFPCFLYLLSCSEPKVVSKGKMLRS